MEQLRPSTSVEQPEGPVGIYSYEPLGPPPSLDGLADLGKDHANGKTPLQSEAQYSKTPSSLRKALKFKYRKKSAIAPAVSPAAAPAAAPAPAIIGREVTNDQLPQSQSKAIEYSRWTDKLLNPRIASEREICIELERVLSPDEKRRWDEFRQYFRSLAGDNAENKAEIQAFQPFQNRTRLSWRVVEIAEHELKSGSNGAGASVKKCAPYICIEGVRTKENAQKLHAFLSKRKARAEYHPPFKLCYSLAHIRAPASRDQLSIQLQPSDFSLCGALVTKTDVFSSASSTFTIGGLIQIGNEVFALSSRHDDVFEKEGETDESSEDLVEKLRGSTDYDEDIDPPLILQPESLRLESDLASHVEPEQRSPTDQTEQSQTLVGELAYTGDEWCLYGIDKPSQHLPNCVELMPATYMSSQDGTSRNYIDTIAQEPIDGGVVVVGGKSGQVHAQMSPNTSDIFLPSGKVLEVWRIKFDRETRGIRPGDSGSWVVDLQAGVVFGHIIAMTNDAAYVLPMKDIFKDIDSKAGKNPGCRLVSAFHCLADLAKFHNAASPPRATMFALEALSPGVLDHSTPTASVNLLRVYLGRCKGSSAERSTLVSLLTMNGSNLQLSVISGSALEQARDTGLGNPDVSTRVVEELMEIAFPNQGTTSENKSDSPASGLPALSMHPSKVLRRNISPPTTYSALGPPNDYIVEDMDPVTTPADDAWVEFSRSRYSHRSYMVQRFEEAERQLIEREELRIDALRRLSGLAHSHAKDQHQLLEDLGLWYRLWRQSAISHVEDELATFRQGGHKGLSNRDQMIMHQVNSWQRVSTQLPNMIFPKAYNNDNLALSSIADEEYLFWVDASRRAGVVIWDKGVGGISVGNDYVHGDCVHGVFPHQKIPLRDLLHMGPGSLLPASRMRTGSPSGKENIIQYFHLPANHVRWVDDFMLAYYSDPTWDRLQYSKYREILSSPKDSFLWGSSRQRERNLAPIHARQISPHCVVSQSKPLSPKETDKLGKHVALFMPYLHWEDPSSLRRTRRYVRAREYGEGAQARARNTVQRNVSPRLGEVSQPKPLTDLVDKLLRKRPPHEVLGRGMRHDTVWSPRLPLARFLLCAAKLYQLFEEAEDVTLALKDVRSPSPLHMRRTLDQFHNWPSADNTERRDTEQTVHRESQRQRQQDKQRALSTPCIMVDQLWLWVLDDNTVLSSFPQNWGDRHGQGSSNVYANISKRIGALRPGEVDSVYDIALIIIDECSKVLFSYDLGVRNVPDIMGLYGSALSRLATRTSAAYNAFKSDAQASYTEDTLASIGRILRRSQGLCMELNILDELKKAMEELQTMGDVFSQQISVLEEFERILQQLGREADDEQGPEVTAGHSKTKDRAAAMTKEMICRRSELEQLEKLYKAVQLEFQSLQDLQQQQVSTAHARIALQGIYEQGVYRDNATSVTTPQYRINSAGRVVSARGRGFIEKGKAKASGAAAGHEGGKVKRRSTWARIGEAFGLRKRDRVTEKSSGLGDREMFSDRRRVV